jgi:hypothetical protein
VKRAFSFKRKQQRTHKPVQSSYDNDGYAYYANENVDSQLTGASENPSGGALGALKRSFSWGRRSKTEKNKEPVMEEEVPMGLGIPKIEMPVKRTFSWNRK